MARVALPLSLLLAWIAPSLPAQETRPTPAPTESRPTDSAPTASAPTESGRAASGRSRDGKPKREKKEPPRDGIPVSHPLLDQQCVRCHKVDEKKQMSRISFMRKSPEGWSTSIKRMVRLYDVRLTPDEARKLVRYLATDLGLTRDEAKRSLYESERRVHWSEEHHDKDLRDACSKCHTLGRVFAEYRDKKEWDLLRATHLAYFPLSSRQVGGTPRRPRDEDEDEQQASDDRSREWQQRQREQRGRGDRVLKKLAEDQPLFTPEWKDWTVNRRSIPLAGKWALFGHEVGRGPIRGTVTLTENDDDMFTTQWDFRYANGERVTRSGRGLLYAGFSWRGRTRQDDVDWREVLLLDADWHRFEGRIFTGEYAEVGADVELFRVGGSQTTFHIGNRAVRIPSTGHVLDVYGDGFRADMPASDFHLGKGVDVRGVEFVDANHVRLSVDVAEDCEVGERTLSFGVFSGRDTIQLYDAVDYVRIVPRQGLARIGGGGKQPKQFERFELQVMHRGPDGKSYTEDDIVLEHVYDGVRWSLAEFHSREDDDDLKYVGAIDGRTGHFTPAIDGPNEERKWKANNVGEVYVVAEVELERAVRVEPEPTPEDTDAKGEGEDKGEGKDKKDETKTPPKPPPPVLERRTWRARTPLVVTVPRYVRFEALDWEDD